MTRIAIMQPTYLPWAGYFNMMAAVDVFVFLDDVRFSPRSWQQRNRILLQGTARWLTVPVEGGRDQLLREVRTDEGQPWRRIHEQTATQAYARHPFRQQALGPFVTAIAGRSNLLAEINRSLISCYAAELGIHTPTLCSSSLSVGGRKSERLLNICLALGATGYLSAEGSRDYVEADGIFRGSGVSVSYHSFHAPAYPQVGGLEFVSHLSIIDVVANIGLPAVSRYVGAVH